jgi:hypothetical protein
VPAVSCGVWRRGGDGDICGLRRQRRIDLGRPADGAGVVTRRGGACHAGEARANAAIAGWMAARSQNEEQRGLGKADLTSIVIHETGNHRGYQVFQQRRRGEIETVQSEQFQAGRALAEGGCSRV